MKLHILLLAAALVSSALRAETPATIAYWPFGESGLTDASGDGRTLSGGATINDCAWAGTASSVQSTMCELRLRPSNRRSSSGRGRHAGDQPSCCAHALT